MVLIAWSHSIRLPTLSDYPSLYVREERCATARNRELGVHLQPELLERGVMRDGEEQRTGSAPVAEVVS